MGNSGSVHNIQGVGVGDLQSYYQTQNHMQAQAINSSSGDLHHHHRQYQLHYRSASPHPYDHQYQRQYGGCHGSHYTTAGTANNITSSEWRKSLPRPPSSMNHHGEEAKSKSQHVKVLPHLRESLKLRSTTNGAILHSGGTISGRKESAVQSSSPPPPMVLQRSRTYIHEEQQHRAADQHRDAPHFRRSQTQMHIERGVDRAAAATRTLGNRFSHSSASSRHLGEERGASGYDNEQQLHPMTTSSRDSYKMYLSEPDLRSTAGNGVNNLSMGGGIEATSSTAFKYSKSKIKNKKRKAPPAPAMSSTDGGAGHKSFSNLVDSSRAAAAPLLATTANEETKQSAETNEFNERTKSRLFKTRAESTLIGQRASAMGQHQEAKKTAAAVAAVALPQRIPQRSSMRHSKTVQEKSSVGGGEQGNLHHQHQAGSAPSYRREKSFDATILRSPPLMPNLESAVVPCGGAYNHQKSILPSKLARPNTDFKRELEAATKRRSLIGAVGNSRKFPPQTSKANNQQETRNATGHQLQHLSSKIPQLKRTFYFGMDGNARKLKVASAVGETSQERALGGDSSMNRVRHKGGDAAQEEEAASPSSDNIRRGTITTQMISKETAAEEAKAEIIAKLPDAAASSGRAKARAEALLRNWNSNRNDADAEDVADDDDATIYSLTSSNQQYQSGCASTTADDNGIQVIVRPTLPRRQLEIPRFSPAAAWRMLNEEPPKGLTTAPTASTGTTAKQTTTIATPLLQLADENLDRGKLVTTTTNTTTQTEERIYRTYREPYPLVLQCPDNKSGDSGISGDDVYLPEKPIKPIIIANANDYGEGDADGHVDDVGVGDNEDDGQPSTSHNPKRNVNVAGCAPTPATERTTAAAFGGPGPFLAAWTPQQDLEEEDTSSDDDGDGRNVCGSPTGAAGGGDNVNSDYKTAGSGHFFSLSLPREHQLSAIAAFSGGERDSEVAGEGGGYGGGIMEKKPGFSSLQKLKRSVSGGNCGCIQSLTSFKSNDVSSNENFFDQILGGVVAAATCSGTNGVAGHGMDKAGHGACLNSYRSDNWLLSRFDGSAEGGASAGAHTDHQHHHQIGKTSSLLKAATIDAPPSIHPKSLTYLTAGKHVMYLPNKSEKSTTVRTTTTTTTTDNIISTASTNMRQQQSAVAPRKKDHHRAPRENLQDPPSRNVLTTATNSNTSKSQRFSFQSTVRQIERRRLAEKLSKDAEEKEAQRKSELEAMRRVEEDFQRKRAYEKASIRHQLRLYSSMENKCQPAADQFTSLPLDYYNQCNGSRQPHDPLKWMQYHHRDRDRHHDDNNNNCRAEPDGAVSSTSPSPVFLQRQKQIAATTTTPTNKKLHDTSYHAGAYDSDDPEVNASDPYHPVDGMDVALRSTAIEPCL